MARRKTNNLQIRRPEITIIGEGLTEHFYFKHIKKLKGYRYMCRPRYFTKQTLTDLDRLIQEVIDNDGVAVCVFDADVTRMHASDKTQLEKMKRKYAKTNNVILCDSMPSIEFWFLLHYISTNRYYGSSAEVVMHLRKYITDYDKSQTYLEKEKWVSDLISDGKLEEAITRAKAIFETGESYSNIHRAFEAFEDGKNRIFNKCENRFCKQIILMPNLFMLYKCYKFANKMISLWKQQYKRRQLYSDSVLI